MRKVKSLLCVNHVLQYTVGRLKMWYIEIICIKNWTETKKGLYILSKYFHTFLYSQSNTTCIPINELKCKYLTVLYKKGRKQECIQKKIWFCHCFFKVIVHHKIGFVYQLPTLRWIGEKYGRKKLFNWRQLRLSNWYIK